MKRGTQNESNTSSPTLEFELGYIYHGIQSQLDTLAAKTGFAVTSRDLADRVGALLLAETGGEVLGTADHMPAMRRASRPRKGKTVAKVAVASDPRSNGLPKRKLISAPVARHTRPFLPEEVDQIMLLHKDGLTSREIGDRIGRQASSVHSVIKRHTGGRRKRRLSPKAIASLRRAAAHAREVLAQRRLEARAAAA